MKPSEACATTDCLYAHTPRSEWCLPCRTSLYRWLGMTPRQRDASAERAEYRWQRVTAFRGRTQARRRKAA